MLVSEDMMKHFNQSYKDKNDLDDEMNKILNDGTISASEKWKLYQQVLHRFLNVKDEPVKVNVENWQQPTQPIQSVGQSADQSVGQTAKPTDFTKYMPKSYRKRGKDLLENIERTAPNIKWNNFGEVSIDGKPIAGTSIEKLVMDLLRPTATDPEGWHEFGRALVKANVRRSDIANVKRRELIFDPGREEETPRNKRKRKPSQKLLFSDQVTPQKGHGWRSYGNIL